MRRVVDCSGLESEELAAFLRASPKNLAVLSDFCAWEAFQRGLKARALFQILARHPGQAIILKNTTAISNLRPRRKGLFARLVDTEETEDFPKYAAAVAVGHSPLVDRLRHKQEDAKAFFESLLPAAERLKSQMLAILESHSAEDLRALRTQRYITESFARRIEEGVATHTRLLVDAVPGIGRLPGSAEVKYSYPFRFAVCHYSLAASWAASGGLQSRTVENFRNDLTDCSHAAHATFFDGLITTDKRLRDLHALAVRLLHDIFKIGPV